MRRTIAVPTWSVVTSVGFALLLIVVNSILLLRFHKVASTAQALYDRERPPIGVPFPNLHGTTLEGAAVDLDTSRLKSKVLLLFLSSSCAECETNFPAWQRLAKANKDVETVFVDLPGTAKEDYVKRHDLVGETVLRGLDPAMQLTLNIRGTPTTVILDRRGRIENSWTGVLAQPDEADALRLLLETGGAGEKREGS